VCAVCVVCALCVVQREIACVLCVLCVLCRVRLRVCSVCCAERVVPSVSSFGLLIAVSKTTLNSKGAIASPCLRALLTLNSGTKCLQILTLTLFKILHRLTFFFWEYEVHVSNIKNIKICIS